MELSPDDHMCLAGIVGMCKEHLGVALALKVPVFFVVTKVDICPGHVLQHSLATLSSILRKPGIKKKPYMVIDLSPRTCLHWAFIAPTASRVVTPILARLLKPLIDAGQKQGGCLNMRAAHPHRFPCTCLSDLVCDWRWARACQAVLQLASTKAQMGRQGM